MPRRRVALIVETSSAYGRRILRGIRRYVHTHQSWSIFLEHRSLTTHPPQWLDGWGGDGIISRSTTEGLAKATARSHVPIVDLTDRFGSFGPPQVWSDDRAIGRLGVDHLRERGFKRFAFCGFSRESWSDRRLEEFASMVQQLGQECFVYQSPWFGDDAPPWEVEQEPDLGLARIPPSARSGSWPATTFEVSTSSMLAGRWAWRFPKRWRSSASMMRRRSANSANRHCRASSPTPSLIGYKAAELLDGLMSGQDGEVTQLDDPPPGSRHPAVVRYPGHR